MAATVIFGLGSNKGDRAAWLKQAVELLSPAIKALRCSCLYETAAMLPEGAPPEWDMPFLNMAVAGETALSPQDLLGEIKAIEKKLGRTPAERWAPREIDIDILAMGDTVLVLPDLAIPHPGLLARDFALLPLVELAPDWRYPNGDYAGWKAADIAADRGYTSALQHKKGIAVYG